MIAWRSLRKGEKHYDTALTRAILATGLTFARRDAEAMREFTLAIPVLVGTTNEADDEDATVTVSADRRLQTVLEAYITLLARSNLPTRAEEGLRLSDLHKQAVAQAALLSNVLAEPSEERDPNAVKDLQEELARLRKDRQGARREIQRRFPEYASLIRPPPQPSMISAHPCAPMKPCCRSISAAGKASCGPYLRMGQSPLRNWR